MQPISTPPKRGSINTDYFSRMIDDAEFFLKKLRVLVHNDPNNISDIALFIGGAERAINIIDKHAQNRLNFNRQK